MAQQQQASVIRRKTRAAREGADPRVMSPVRALRLALARAADTLLDLALVVVTVEQRRVEAGEAETVLGDEGLYLLLDGADGARAAMRLCPGLVAALIEVQTTGRVRPDAPRPRASTPTDAAMVAPLVDALLAGFDAGMDGGGADHAPRGFHFGDRVEDARALSLLMVAPEFDFFRLTVDLGPGLRSGRLDLLLPPAPSPPPPARGAVAGGAGRVAVTRAPEDMAAVVLAAPVTLDAVLARIRLPLRDAMALEVGQRLDVAPDSLGRVRLTGAGGHVVAEGRLGRRDGRRALRLSGAGTPRAGLPSAANADGSAGQGQGQAPPRARATPPAGPRADGPDAQAPPAPEADTVPDGPGNGMAAAQGPGAGGKTLAPATG